MLLKQCENEKITIFRKSEAIMSVWPLSCHSAQWLSAFLHCLLLVCVRLYKAVWMGKLRCREEKGFAWGFQIKCIPSSGGKKLQIAHFSLGSSNLLSCRPALFICAWAVSKVTCPWGWVGGFQLQRGGEALPVLQAGSSDDNKTMSTQLLRTRSYRGKIYF